VKKKKKKKKKKKGRKKDRKEAKGVRQGEQGGKKKRGTYPQEISGKGLNFLWPGGAPHEDLPVRADL